MIKVLITLAFLASGSYQTLVGQSAFHNVLQTTVSRAVRQVTGVLSMVYRKYVKWPTQWEERNKLKTKFYLEFAIPDVLASIDGMHVASLRPHVHEERYFNRKGFHSLNVMIINQQRRKMARVKAVFSPRGVACGSSHSLSMCIVALMILGFPSAHSQLNKIYLDDTDLSILVDETHLLNMVQVGEYNTTLYVTAVIQHPDILQLVPATVEIPGSNEPNDSAKITYEICAYGKSPGHSEVTFNVTPAGFVNVDSVFLRVVVMHSNTIYIISYIMGWIYFAAWSVSFYPQIYINFKRKSVVGLNFDFLTLNIMGFTMYSLFNCGLYFSQEIQTQYFERHPRGHNPVQLNDVFFSLHATFATLVTITQCFLYERDEQRVSMTGRGIMSVFAAVVVVTGSLGAAGKIEWLDFLYYCSYIKLSITFIKYVPQAYMNYKRKSTVGWSIGNIFLDFIGGFLSILQMMLNAYNYNDWASFFGDFTKFGLGAFSLIFDIFFMTQHYVLYRAGKDFIMVNSSDEGSDMSSVEGKEFYMLGNSWEARYIRLPGTVSTAEEETEDRPGEEENAEPYQGAPA